MSPSAAKKSKNLGSHIHQEVFLPAPPTHVYDTYLTSREHAKFTGSTAKMSSEIGGLFSCWDDTIEGVNVDLLPGQRIVQAWRLSEWEEGVYSIVTFNLKKKGKGTLLVMDHYGFPAEEKKDLENGWKEFYWEPLRAYFTGHQ